MKEMSKRLAAITASSGPEALNEAREIMRKLKHMNLRWNISALDAFVKTRRQELFPQDYGK
jgi:hypothetical protein